MIAFDEDWADVIIVNVDAEPSALEVDVIVENWLVATLATVKVVPLTKEVDVLIEGWSFLTVVDDDAEASISGAMEDWSVVAAAADGATVVDVDLGPNMPLM